MAIFISHHENNWIPEGIMLACDALDAWEPMADVEITGEECRELQRIRHENRKREFLISRSLLRQLHRLMFPDESETFEVLRDVGGKPYGLSRSRVVPVAIAHSPSHVFVAMSHSFDIGLDVESESRPEHPRLRQRLLHPIEWNDEALHSYPTLQLWTVKESILKLQGTGLRRSMRSLRLRIRDGSLVTEAEGRFIGVNSFRLQGHWVAISEYISAPSDSSY